MLLQVDQVMNLELGTLEMLSTPSVTYSASEKSCIVLLVLFHLPSTRRSNSSLREDYTTAYHE